VNTLGWKSFSSGRRGGDGEVVWNPAFPTCDGPIYGGLRRIGRVRSYGHPPILRARKRHRHRLGQFGQGNPAWPAGWAHNPSRRRSSASCGPHWSSAECWDPLETSRPTTWPESTQFHRSRSRSAPAERPPAKPFASIRSIGARRRGSTRHAGCWRGCRRQPTQSSPPAGNET
jgi:hypothetical protein